MALYLMEFAHSLASPASATASTTTETSARPARATGSTFLDLASLDVDALLDLAEEMDLSPEVEADDNGSVQITCLADKNTRIVATNDDIADGLRRCIGACIVHTASGGKDAVND